jgi:nicotinamide mononucleotide transporter
MTILWQGLQQVFSVQRVFSELITLARRERWLVFIMMAATVAAFYYSTRNIYDVLALITGLATVLNLILVDRGRLTNYLWGFISTSVWLVVALENRLIGDIASQGFYFIMQFVGIYAWQKQLSQQTLNQTEIAPKRLTPLQVVGAVSLALVIYAIVVYVSHRAQGSQIWLDATLLPLGILGQILMTYGYRSQWVAWIALNVINIVIWYNQVQMGGASAQSMLILQVVMLINSLYGAYMWSRTNEEVVLAKD